MILGFNNTASYKNFELSLNLYSELGKKKYSGTLSSLESGEGFMMVTQDYFDKRWHPVDNPMVRWQPLIWVTIQMTESKHLIQTCL